MNKIIDGKVLIFGDLHLSASFNGKHKDYLIECYESMDKIIDKVKEHKASSIIFLGDLIGVRERNINDRRFFARVLQFFITLNELTNGNVYSVKGNHDFGDYSDFDCLIQLGLIKNPNYIDYIHQIKTESGNVLKERVEVRFHLVNYGEEDREINLCVDDESANVVLGHNDYAIDGVTNWYKHKDEILLARQDNFSGCDLVISGHIHLPSLEFYTVTMRGGKETLTLYYPGSVQRVAEKHNDCSYLEFYYDDASVAYNVHFLGLPPSNEIYFEEEQVVESPDEEEKRREAENLKSIVKDIMESNLTNGDLFNQIRIIPGASDKVKDIACSYLQKAIDSAS